MNLVINNNIIDSNLEDILKEIRRHTDGRFLKDIIRRGDNIAITCPWHKDGLEKHPSCYVYARNDSDDVPFGFYKCFTCGSKGQLYQLVSRCLNCGIEEAKQWLIDNFSKTITEELISLPEINLYKNRQPIKYIDESFLNQYAYIHPYMTDIRKIPPEILFRFKVGWNPETDAITFPIWDEWGRLIGISERKVKYKQFDLPKGLPKVVYLLDEIIAKSITEVYVVESQIDALYLWSIGKSAVALFGTGSKEQYNLLKKSGIRIFHLALDGDMAGRHGNIRFIQNMPNDLMIDVLMLPNGKDINDLSKEEIENLKIVDKNNYLQNIDKLL